MRTPLHDRLLDRAARDAEATAAVSASRQIKTYVSSKRSSKTSVLIDAGQPMLGGTSAPRHDPFEWRSDRVLHSSDQRRPARDCSRHVGVVSLPAIARKRKEVFVEDD
jgi:hypothetical protein